MKSVFQKYPAIVRGLTAGSISLALFTTACGDNTDDGVGPPSGMTPPPAADSGPNTATIPSPVVTNDGGVASNPNPIPITQNDAGVGPVQNTVPGEWCKAKAVLEKHCTTCHDGKGSFGSPFALVTLADLKKDAPGFAGKKIYERANARMHDAMRPMPAQGVVPAADKEVIAQWAAAGAPGSDAEMCAPVVKPVVEQDWPPADCEEKYQLLANNGSGAKFNVRTGQYYQDFLITPPWKGEVQGVGFRAIVDNKKVLHHYIVYDAKGAFLIGWSPGKNDHVLPKDVGMFLPPASAGQLKMTVHYYNMGADAKDQPDGSGVEVCVTRTKKRANTAAVMPFTAFPMILPNTPMTENTATCTVKSTKPVTLITSSPHAHGLGIHAKLVVKRANGMTEVVHDKPFNFEEQTTYPINVVLNNGDRVTTTCIYRNSPNLVIFGFNTEEEMCFNFAQYYPMCGMTCAPDDPAAGVIHSNQGGGCPGS
jgi:hypothetical protein